MFGQNANGFLHEDISEEDKLEILRNEIRNWKKSRYTFQLRHRVFTNLDSQEQLRMVEKELVGIEQALDVCIKEWKRLTDKPIPEETIKR